MPDIDGPGSHRNHYDGGDYIYGHAEFEGWNGTILVIVDISDPENPVEAGRAWWPGQAPDEETTEEAEKANFHGPAYPDSSDDPTYAYLSYGDLGMVTADISDPTDPEFVDRTDFSDIGDTPVANHTAVLQPGTDTVWTSSEAIFKGTDEQWTYVFGIDKADPDSDHILSVFPTPTLRNGSPIVTTMKRAVGSGRTISTTISTTMTTTIPVTVMSSPTPGSMPDYGSSMYRTR